MDTRGSLAASLFACVMVGCAASGPDEAAGGEAPIPEQVLDISVDTVDIVHGALRIIATMVDGSAEVSLRLGGECDHRDVGGGLSTPSTLVWSLGEADVADAIACGLVVRARGRDGAQLVDKVADLTVATDIAGTASAEGAGASGSDIEGPQPQSITASMSGVTLVFTSVSASGRLSTVDGFLDRVQPEDDTTTDDDSVEFEVARIGFARSILRRQPLLLDGMAFSTTLSVGGTPLAEEPQEERIP
jgi:hypothetical protein